MLYTSLNFRICVMDFDPAQGRNEVRWGPGQKASLTPPCSNLRSFGSKCTIEESTCDIVWTLRRPPHSSGAPAVIQRPHNDSAPGKLCPFCHPSLHPCTLANNVPVSDKNALSVPIFSVIDRILFKIPKKLRKLFSHNVLKSRLVNIVTTSFITITWQMTEMSSRKKTGACSSSSRNYDLTMQFCNILLHQQGQRSVALKHLCGSTTRLNKPWYSILSSQL